MQPAITPSLVNRLDVSRRALSIARVIDRLPAGNFSIILLKPDIKTDNWRVEIRQSSTVQILDLPKI